MEFQTFPQTISYSGGRGGGAASFKPFPHSLAEGRRM